MLGRYSDGMTTCSIDACGRDVYAHGWCEKHYRRWYRWGSPHAEMRSHGDAAGWSAVHARLARQRGPASQHTCQCGEPALDWAFDEPSGHSHDLDRYTAMCRRCHNAMDRSLVVA